MGFPLGKSTQLSNVIVKELPLIQMLDFYLFNPQFIPTSYLLIF